MTVATYRGCTYVVKPAPKPSHVKLVYRGKEYLR